MKKKKIRKKKTNQRSFYREVITVGENKTHLKTLTLLHSEWSKLYGVLAGLSAIGLKQYRIKHTVLTRNGKYLSSFGKIRYFSL